MINKIHSLSIKKRMLFASIIPALFLFVLMIGKTLVERTNDAEDYLINRAEMIATLVSTISEIALVSQNADFIKSQIQKISQENDVLLIEIINLDRSLFFAVRKKTEYLSHETISVELPVTRIPNSDIQLFDEIDTDSNENLKESLLGFVRVEMSKQSLVEAQKSILLDDLAVGIIFLIVCLSFVLCVSRKLTSQLIKIDRHVSKIAEGDLKSRLGEIGDGEIGTIAKNIDFMSSVMEQSNIERDEQASILMKARDEADRANIDKTIFLRKICTACRVPLNHIKSPLEKLSKAPLSPNLRDLIKNALNGVYDILQINNDLLDFSSIELGDLDLNEDRFQVKDEIEKASRIFANEIAQKSITFELMYTGVYWGEKVVGDATRFRQAIHNLVCNAVKYTSQGGITIRAHSELLKDNRVLYTIDISDTGQGIDKDHLVVILDAFNQSDDCREYSGLGMGLTLSDRIINLMGGEIGARSSLSIGSTFTVSLPLPVFDAQKTYKNIISQLKMKALLIGVKDEELLKDLLRLKGVEADSFHPGILSENDISSIYKIAFVDLSDNKSVEYALTIRKNSKNELLKIIGIGKKGMVNIELDLSDIIETPLRKIDVLEAIRNSDKIIDLLDRFVSSS